MGVRAVNTGVSAGSAQGHASTWLGTSSGTDTITATADPAITAYAAGQHFKFKAGGTTTGAATLNIDDVGAIAIQQRNVAIGADEITANNVVEVVYDGTNFQMLSPGDAELLDTLFRILDNSDPTKKIAFQASMIATGTVRTITMPDADVDLGTLGTGDLLSSNDLSDVNDAATSLSNIGGIGAATTDTLTNKTFDANGTGNSLSNIDITDLANGTDGELITWDAAGAPAAVPVGTAAQVLTSNGVGAEPTFQDAGGGGDIVKLGALTASTSASLDFNSMLDSTTYGGYFMILNELLPATAGTSLLIRYSIDNGISFISAANTYESSGNRTTVSGTTDTSWSMTADTTKTSIDLTQSLSRNFEAMNGKIFFSGFEDSADSFVERTNMCEATIKVEIDEFMYTYGRADNATSFSSEINAIQLLMSSGNITSGIVTLYGVKK